MPLSSGFFTAVKSMATLATVGIPAGTMAKRWHDLKRVSEDKLQVHPDSRLAAFKSTLGHQDGTTGYAANRAIGLIYIGMGTFGEEQIGQVFGSPEAQEQMAQPVDSGASRQLAQMEYDYWSSVLNENPGSSGARIATAFNPDVRDFLQKEVFSRSPFLGLPPKQS
ncbi:MAG: hypothetical protein AAGF11_38195 [Myxococcota bacterium]